MKKIFLVISIVFFSFQFGNTQNVVINEDVNYYDNENLWGPNYLHYGYFYLGADFAAGITDGERPELNYFFTNGKTFGYRYKLKVAKFYAVGLDFSCHVFDYQLKSDANEIFVIPPTYETDKELLRYNGLTAEFFNRFSFGRRGNVIGKFLDIGVYGSYFGRVAHIRWAGKDDVNLLEAESIKIKYLNPEYMEKTQYGLKARLGYNQFVITASYRLSDLITPTLSDVMPNDVGLPRLNIGFEIGLFF